MLSDIVTDIHAQLVIIDATIATAQPTALIGSHFLHENSAPPRVVWLPLRAKPGALDQRGVMPRSLGTRTLSVACHIWGTDTTAAETLLNNVFNAARRSLGSGARWESEDWPQQDGDQVLQLGELVIVVFEFRIPITETGQLVQTVTGLPQTTSMAFGDGQLVSGTPAP